ncbi:MAG: hypothetical protein IKA82_01290 [Clostridia bacterium]|nr:hypothetical protein [Clostridia bacterium]
MLPTPRNYIIRPAIAEVGKTTHFYVIPTERCFLFVNDKEYDVLIIHTHGDEGIPGKRLCRSKFTVKASGGVLEFDYTFEDEQEHLIIVSRPEDPATAWEMRVYSVKSDLYGLRPMKGDLHTHSYRSDGRRDPAALAGHLREQGYDCFALTDHNRFYPGGEIDEVYEGVNTGMCRIIGEEIHTPGSPVHIVRIGGENKSVTEQYVLDLDGYYKAIEEYLTRVPENIPESYKERYARALWATDRVHELGGIAILPHPYWYPKTQLVFNLCDDFVKTLLRSGMFDAYELFGGMQVDGCNRSVNMWNELRIEGIDVPVVASSDVHNLERSAHFPHKFTVCFVEEPTSEGVKNAVKKGLSVAIEAVGTEYDRQHRCYSSLRLVSYTQFLLREYFFPLQKLSHGVGIAMRAYAIEGAPKELVELQQNTVEGFMDVFFGRTKPKLPSAEMMEFEERWRDVHIKRGPITKGGDILGTVVSRQI